MYRNKIHPKMRIFYHRGTSKGVRGEIQTSEVLRLTPKSAPAGAGGKILNEESKAQRNVQGFEGMWLNTSRRINPQPANEKGCKKYKPGGSASFQPK
jgi:hypothetical protein